MLERVFDEDRHLQMCPVQFSAQCADIFFIPGNFDRMHAVTQLPDEEATLSICAVRPVAMRPAPG